MLDYPLPPHSIMHIYTHRSMIYTNIFTKRVINDIICKIARWSRLRGLTLYDWRNRRISSDTMCFMSSSMSTSARLVYEVEVNILIRSSHVQYIHKCTWHAHTLTHTHTHTHTHVHTHTHKHQKHFRIYPKGFWPTVYMKSGSEMKVNRLQLRDIYLGA